MIDLKRTHISFTGRLQTMTRKDAMALARACGAFPHIRPVETTQVIVAGVVKKPLGEKMDTQKLEYAKQFTLPVITEREFLEWCSAQITRWLTNIS